MLCPRRPPSAATGNSQPTGDLASVTAESEENAFSGIIMTAVGILANIILAPTVGIILISLIVVGVLAMVNGGMNVRSAKKGLARQAQAPDNLRCVQQCRFIS